MKTDRQRPELLAPAGSREALIAAVQAGADAVYIGGTDFSARAMAKNFSDDEMIRIVDYCHLRGVKVYVAVNTLVSDREFEKAARYIGFINNIGADAIIVQDLGVARLAREIAPELSLHVSTQAFVNDADGVRYFGQLGFKRAVVAREITMRQIQSIVRDTDMEIEIFVHGAICICYSGQCLMSSFIGGRSGNRGRCAQPCRLLYNAGGKKGYLLSPKDMCLIRHLEDIRKAGVSSLKIEGRMKGADYVSTVTGIYRRYLDNPQAVTEEDYEILERVFYRGGFTDGYFTGKKGRAMLCPQKPDNPYEKQRKSTFVPIGEAKAPVSIQCRLRLMRPIEIVMSDDNGNSVSYKGTLPAERAAGAPLTEERIYQQLSKLGGTVFYARDINIEIEDFLSLPVSEINSARREAARLLEEKIANSFRRRPAKEYKTVRILRPPCNELKTAVQISTKAQLEAIDLKECDRIYIPLDIISKLKNPPDGAVAVLPRISPGGFFRILEDLPIKRALMTNIGQYYPLKELNFEIYADYSLNIFNTMAAEHFSYAGAVTVSTELTLSQIKGISARVPVEAVAYGRLPLMLTENCIIKGSGRCRAFDTLVDRYGVSFPVRCLPGCRNEVLNSKPIVMSDKLDDIRKSGINTIRLLFTTETPQECAEVLRCYKNEVKMNTDYTRGKFYKGV